MEIDHPVILHLQQQGYARIQENSERTILQMFKLYNPPRYYPRFHLMIPGTELGFNFMEIKLHLDIKSHSAGFSTNVNREITVREIRNLAGSLQESSLSSEHIHQVTSSLNGLLLFEAAEALRNPINLPEPPIDRFFRSKHGNLNVRHQKYRRDPNWRNHLEELLFA